MYFWPVFIINSLVRFYIYFLLWQIVLLDNIALVGQLCHIWIFLFFLTFKDSILVQAVVQKGFHSHGTHDFSIGALITLSLFFIKCFKYKMMLSGYFLVLPFVVLYFSCTCLLLVWENLFLWSHWSHGYWRLYKNYFTKTA